MCSFVRSFAYWWFVGSLAVGLVERLFGRLFNYLVDLLIGSLYICVGCLFAWLFGGLVDRFCGCLVGRLMG